MTNETFDYIIIGSGSSGSIVAFRLQEFFPNKKILLIVAHPDDEVLGAGGTLLKHKEKGDNIYWLITTGVFESGGFSKESELS